MAETKFVKTKKERNYTVIDNTFIRDTSLSWKAKGLMTYLLSLPDDWSVNFSEVLKHSSDGETSLRGAINELKKHGYLKSKRLFDNETKKIVGFTYEVIEQPLSENRSVENPYSGKSTQWENHSVENVQLLNTESTKYEFKQNTELNSSAKAGTETVKQKSDFQIVMDSYFQNYKNLYEQKAVLTEKPIINMKQAGKMIKDLLPIFGKDKILSALDKALLDNWIVGQGYSLTTILSSNQLNKLINSKGVPARQNYNCVHEFDDKIMLEEM